MNTTIKISEEIISAAQQHAAVFSRSIPKQVEYWARIGKIAEENPDLPYSFIKELLLGIEQAAAGDVTPYKFGVE